MRDQYTRRSSSLQQAKAALAAELDRFEDPEMAIGVADGLVEILRPLHDWLHSTEQRLAGRGGGSAPGAGPGGEDAGRGGG